MQRCLIFVMYEAIDSPSTGLALTGTAKTKYNSNSVSVLFIELNEISTNGMSFDYHV